RRLGHGHRLATPLAAASLVREVRVIQRIRVRGSAARPPGASRSVPSLLPAPTPRVRAEPPPSADPRLEAVWRCGLAAGEGIRYAVGEAPFMRGAQPPPTRRTQ